MSLYCGGSASLKSMPPARPEWYRRAYLRVNTVWTRVQDTDTDTSAKPAWRYFRLPFAWPAPTSTTPTAIRLASAAPSRTTSARSRPGLSRWAWLAVDFASSLHTVDHTQVQKTTARMSQPIKGADRPAPTVAAAAPPTIAAPRDTSSFVRAEVDNRGTPGWLAESRCIALGWQRIAHNAALQTGRGAAPHRPVNLQRRKAEACGDRLHLSGRRRTGGRCCAAGRLLTLRGRGGWFLQADGVLHTRQEVQRATASTTSVHRPPDPDRRVCLLAFPWAGKCGSRGQEEDRRRRDLLQSRCSASAFVMCVLIEAHDEWQVRDCRYLSGTSMAMLTPLVVRVIS